MWADTRTTENTSQDLDLYFFRVNLGVSFYLFDWVMFFCLLRCLTIFCWDLCLWKKQSPLPVLWAGFIRGNTFIISPTIGSGGLPNLMWRCIFSGLAMCLPNWRGSPVYFSGVCNLLLPLVSVCGTAGCLVLQLASVLSPALEIQSVPISSGEAETSLSLGGSHPKSWKFTHTFYLLFPS